MFIKKDLRKIPLIFADAAREAKEKADAPPMTELRLARRPAEFASCLTVLCQPHYAPTLQHLVSLSLYDCEISNLDGIGFFASAMEDEKKIGDDGDCDGDGDGDVTMADKNRNSGRSRICCPNLAELNLGKNPITSIPSDLGLLKNSLTHLWLDDCQIQGHLPPCIYELTKLKTLRISNNQITHIQGKDGADQWSDMEVLCLDGNALTELPVEFQSLTKLQSLMLRNNQITSLPEGVPGPSHSSLTLFHISSNQLKALPDSICACPSLTHVYANANKITRVPLEFNKLASSLVSCNLSNNEIGSLTNSFLGKFGEPDVHGKCEDFETCSISLELNDVVKRYNDMTASSASAMDVC